MTDAFAGGRMRVIIDNDFSGDPDGLIQLAHHALSTSVDIPFVIGSHLPIGDPFTRSTTSAEDAANAARIVLSLAGRDVPVVAGSNSPMAGRNRPVESDAVTRIIDEAMRDDPRPLYIVCGASLTEIASALLVEPRIAERLTVVWIGGPEVGDPDAATWPDDEIEYNLKGDIAAATVVFNGTSVPLWQVPRSAYRQCLVSLDELGVRLAPHGPLGAHLMSALRFVIAEVAELGLVIGESFCLGDSPLVLLTALQSPFNPQASSSRYRSIIAPNVHADGVVTPANDGRPIRLYTQLDVRLMLEDLYSKLASHALRGGD
jgi:purine nucleosidase